MPRLRDALGSEVLQYTAKEFLTRPDRARRMDLLRLRLDWLAQEDRTWLQLYLNHNVTSEQLARVSGMPSRRIRRRLAALAGRLLGDEYAQVRRKEDLFDRRQLEVAYDHLILGLGYRRIARRRDLRLGTARRRVRELRQWLERDRRESRRLQLRRRRQERQALERRQARAGAGTAGDGTAG